MKDAGREVVVITEGIYEKGRKVFDSVTDLEIAISPADEDTLSEMIKEKNPCAVVLGVDKYTGSLYEALKKGGIIARFGVGYDGIDLKKAKDNELYVTNTPGVLESTVAEFTIFLAGEVLRKIGKINEQMRTGKWHPVMGSELHGKTWAIIGLGKIGKKVSRILTFGFGIDVIAFDIINYGQELLTESGVKKMSSIFSEIIPHADIVSVHLPANPDNLNFLNEARLRQFKPGSVLINTGRGSLIDEEALYDALKDGVLSGAGLDVFKNEPYTPSDMNKDLRKLDNVVLTPHMASSTTECAKRMAERVMQNIRYALDHKFEKMDTVQL